MPACEAAAPVGDGRRVRSGAVVALSGSERLTRGLSEVSTLRGRRDATSQNGPMDSPDPIDIDVGKRLRIRRKQMAISQTELANHLGVSFQQVQKYERGANRISASMLVRAAEKLEISVAELVGEAQGAVADGEVLSMLASSGALDLLRAFSTIEDPRVRSAILDLVRSTSERQPAASRKFGT